MNTAQQQAVIARAIRQAKLGVSVEREETQEFKAFLYSGDTVSIHAKNTSEAYKKLNGMKAKDGFQIQLNSEVRRFVHVN